MPALAPDDDFLGPARARLEARQAALLTALLAHAAVPEDFDPQLIAVQAAALQAKRRRVARRAWPELAAAMGPAFGPTFDAYAQAHPRRTTPRSVPDAVAYAIYLRCHGLLPPKFQLALVRARLRAYLRR
jgi:hypothetical protein